ncbi:MAG: hypothetical protein AAFN09_08745 [Pseudomonadota bacterium]
MPKDMAQSGYEPIKAADESARLKRPAKASGVLRPRAFDLKPETQNTLPRFALSGHFGQMINQVKGRTL